MGSICIVLSGYQRDNPRIFERQSISLLQAGFNVSILVDDGLGDANVKGINIYSLKTSTRLKRLFFSSFFFYKKTLELNSDKYFIHSPELIPLGLFLKLKGKKIYYDAHEDLPNLILDKRINFFIKGILFYISKIFLNISLKFFDGVTTPHLHVKKKVLKINKKTNLVENFPLKYSAKEFDLENYLERGEVLIYTGTIYPHSNQKEVLEVLNNRKKTKYLLAGYMPEEMKKLFNDFNKKNQVDFLGYCNYSELENIYNRASVGISIIDYKKNLGGILGTFAVNKIFEYMSYGLPIICSDYKSWQKIVKDYDCGICVEPKNFNQIESAIDYLLENKKEAFEMGRRGRKAVLEKYNWKEIEAPFLKTFKDEL